MQTQLKFGLWSEMFCWDAGNDSGSAVLTSGRKNDSSSFCFFCQWIIHSSDKSEDSIGNDGPLRVSIAACS